MKAKIVIEFEDDTGTKYEWHPADARRIYNKLRDIFDGSQSVSGQYDFREAIDRQAQGLAQTMGGFGGAS